MKAIAVLTSGGDSPGMNACIRAVVRVAASRGVRVLGVEQGYDGLMEGRFRELTRALPSGALMPLDEVDLIAKEGGTILGSARSQRFMTVEGRKDAAKHLLQTDGLVVIGGNGSLTGAHHLAHECQTPIVGVPASIDNDIGCTSTAIGVDTALNTIVDACDKISDTARAHRRAFVVEVMGRACGYLAMASAVAVAADAVLFREQSRSEDALIAALADVARKSFSAERGKRRVLIIKAEGVEVPTASLVTGLQAAISKDVKGVDVRGVVLGHIVRGGNPTFQDRMVGGRLGLAAVMALAEKQTDVMVAWQPNAAGGTPTDDPAVQRFSIENVLSETAKLIDGSSNVTKRRVKQMEMIEGVLAL
ncbi:MAG: 6-phosphofructokinase [Myxococcaceae bacterium]